MQPHVADQPLLIRKPAQSGCTLGVQLCSGSFARISVGVGGGLVQPQGGKVPGRVASIAGSRSGGNARAKGSLSPNSPALHWVPRGGKLTAPSGAAGAAVEKPPAVHVSV